jgi:hypothetical protein
MEPIVFIAYLAGEDEDGRSSATPVSFRRDYIRVVLELPRSERDAAKRLLDYLGASQTLRVTIEPDV